MNDLFISIALGFIFALTLIVFISNFPKVAGKHKTIDDEILGNKIDANNNIICDAEKKIIKSKKLQKLFGLNSQELQELIDKKKDQDIMNQESSFNFCKILEYLTFFLLIIILLFCMNVWTKGEIFKVMLGLFGRELEILGLKNFIIDYSLKEL